MNSEKNQSVATSKYQNDVNLKSNSTKSTNHILSNDGKFKATQLWNELILLFKKSVPTGRHRHRRNMKNYDNCFNGTEAVDCLHEILRKHKSFSSSITRSQTLQLLQKFYRAHVFEDVRGRQKDNFQDNYFLYKFTEKYKEKAINECTLNRGSPFVNINNIANMDHKSFCKDRSTKLNVTQALNTTKSLSELEIENLWKTQVINRIKLILGVQSVNCVLDPDSINIKHVMHNMTHINKNGIVTNIEKSDQIPESVLSQMKTLAYWPSNSEIYPGFEKDVFSAVHDYFNILEEPLLTYDFYDLFTSVTLILDGDFDFQAESELKQQLSSGLSFVSVENLMVNLTTNITDHSSYANSRTSLADHPYGTFTDVKNSNETSLQAKSLKKPKERCQSLSCENSTLSLFDIYNDNFSNGVDKSMSKMSPEFINEAAFSPSLNRFNKSSVHLMDVNSVGLNPLHSSPKNKYYYSMSNLLEINKFQSNTLKPSKGNPVSNHNTDFLQNYGYSIYFTSKPSVTSKNPPPPYIPPPSYPKLTKHLNNCQSDSFNSEIDNKDSLSSSTGFISAQNLMLTDGQKKSFTALNFNESYRMAVDSSLCHSLNKYQSSSNLDCSLLRRKIEIFQLFFLLIPPANRRKLHLLLRLIDKMLHNNKLSLDKDVSMKSLLLETFTPCIIRSRDPFNFHEFVVLKFVNFLIDNHAEIMKVSDLLKAKINEHVNRIKRAKLGHSRFDSSTNMIFCKQMSSHQYKTQCLSSSQQALTELLNSLINDNKLSWKEKQRKLKMFKKSHPTIYSKEMVASESKLSDLKASHPLHKFKGIRL